MANSTTGGIMVGQTILQYEIIEKIGEGGMGVVYKAQDTKLDRFVALKFLPPHVSSSSDEKARFVQEAKSAAALTHQNICTIHGVEEHDSHAFIVMEYVEGMNLHEMKKGLSLKQAVDIGTQIAEGLAAAHDRGIVHRDIKPENIMIRKDGRVQIMDFGLAKLKGASRLTKEGTTVGTAGYMSPEQVQGQETDHRSDIFSLGVVLYELFTGQLPFKGVHETAVAYEIVNVDAPPMSAIKSELPPELDAIVLDCVEKDPRERTQAASQVALELRRYKRESSRQRASRITAARPAIAAPSSSSMHVPASEATLNGRTLRQRILNREVILLGLGVLFFLSFLGSFYLYFQLLSVKPPVTRATMLPPDGGNFDTDVGGHLAISPNGLMLAFVAMDSTGRSSLWVRPLNSMTAVPFPGTQSAQYPFWSPDNRTIGFFAEGKLKKVDAGGGPVLTVSDAPRGRGGSWNKEGTIVFAPDNGAPLSRVASAGGNPVQLTRLDTSRQETNHRFPFFLPDQNHFLYTAQTSVSGLGEQDAMYVGSLDGSTNKILLHGSSSMMYASGHILFVRQSTLMAQPFDPGSLEFSGDAFPVVENVQYSDPRSKGIWSVSEQGTLVYQSAGSSVRELHMVDRNGRRLATLPVRIPTYNATFSPDGNRLVLDHYDVPSRNYDIWIFDLVRKVETRLTFDQAVEIVPQWSPDGKNIVYSSTRLGQADLYLKQASGAGDEELLLQSSEGKYPTDWSRDGKYLSLSVTGKKTKWDIWILPLQGDREPVKFLETEFNEWIGKFSPDGRWIAYQSDESGKYQVYVRPFSGSGGKWQVSTDGGTGPFWRNDGRELLFESSNKIMSVNVRGAGDSFEMGIPQVLFSLEAKGEASWMGASLDAQRFTVRVSTSSLSVTPVNLILNWDQEIKER